MKITLAGLLLILTAGLSNAQTVNTFAGTAGQAGFVNGNSTAAKFNMPAGMASDRQGNIYIADRLNHSIRKVNAQGDVSVWAGSGSPGNVDAQGTSASFNEPTGVACDTNGNVYVADTKNYKIRMIDSNGMVTTISGLGIFGTTNGPVSIAKFGYPSGIAVTPDGSTIYVSDYNTHVIRKISGGIVSTPAGMIYAAGTANGIGTAANFNHPLGLCLDKAGNLLIADEWNNCIRRMTPYGAVTTVAGSGLPGNTDATGLNATFNYPAAISVDSTGNIFIADTQNHTIRKINSSTLQVTTYAGIPGQPGYLDGSSNAAKFYAPSGVSWNVQSHSVFVDDTENQLLRRVVLVSSVQLSLAASASTLCNGAGFTVQVSPQGLTGYSIYDNGNLIASATAANVSVPPLTPGTHILTATAYDATGAMATGSSVSVTVLNAFIPAVTVTNNGNICPGDSIKLTVQSGSSWLWSNGASSQNIYISSAGNYAVTVTGSNGCTGTSIPVSVSMLSSPVISITASATQTCPGQYVALTATAGSTYAWSDGSVSQTDSVTAGTYTVTVTGSNGCRGISPAVSISNYPVNPPVITPPGPILLLQGDSLNLSVSGGSNYNWSNGSTGSSAMIYSAGNYTVSAIVQYGCRVNSIPVQVVIFNSQGIISVNGLTSFCDGDSVILTSLFNSGNQWFYNGQPLAGASLPQLVAYAAGYYKVGIWQTDHYLFSDSVLITVKPMPNMPQVSDITICSNVPVPFAVNNPEPGVIYNWYAQDSSGALLSTGVTGFLTPFTTSAPLYVEAVGSNGCKLTDRSVMNVFVQAAPQCSFSSSAQFQNGVYAVNIINTTSNADTYQWITGDTSSGTNINYDQSPVIIYPSAGSYDILLIALNNAGCTDTLLKRITVSANNSSYLPTTFTPNGDGKNDLFRVRGDHLSVQEMLIYDQWGTLIFHTGESNPYWDGLSSGKPVPDGTYVYRIRILNDQQVSSELTGSITVIR